VLIHVIDLAAAEGPLAQYAILRRTRTHDPALLRRTVLVALNKIDLPEARDRLAPTAAALAAQEFRRPAFRARQVWASRPAAGAADARPVPAWGGDPAAVKN
jgi:GTPase involved in cell partitioning and DNA repair